MTNPAAFFAHIRALPFNGSMSQPQVDGVNATLAAWVKFGDGDERKLAYVLATKYWETNRTMQPIREIGLGAGHPYGVPTGPYHQVYYGRGDVQTTWLVNYQKATVELQRAGVIGANVDLARDPDLLLQDAIAAPWAVIGMMRGLFTGVGLARYINQSKCDFLNARRVINSTNKAALVAGFANEFLTALRAADAPASS